MSYWHHKTAIITGGSSGLGRALAEALAAGGARLVLAARNGDRLQAVADRLREEGGEVHAVAADITRQEDVQRLFTEAADRFDHLDLLANCAGRSSRASVLDTTADEVRELMELNLLGTIRCTRAALPRLIETKGHLVNIGSLASKVATPYHGGYPATKSAVAAYTQQLRLTLAPEGVHVLLVCPGPIAAAGDKPAASNRPVDDNVPEAAQRPGAGAKLSAIDPHRLAARILTACERRRPELVVPARARLLFALSALSPRFGDWLLRRFSAT
jgi:short-subunit dehydrogenase